MNRVTYAIINGTEHKSTHRISGSEHKECGRLFELLFMLLNELLL